MVISKIFNKNNSINNFSYKYKTFQSIFLLIDIFSNLLLNMSITLKMDRTEFPVTVNENFCVFVNIDPVFSHRLCLVPTSLPKPLSTAPKCLESPVQKTVGHFTWTLS